MSKYVRPGKPAGGGFTLVELLVVIAIIGMLAALLTPALMAARERARQTICLNHQKELSGAILLFESSAGHFPGFVNAIPGNYVSGGTLLNWCEVVLPQIGRQDLWNGDGLWPPPTGTGITGFRTGVFSAVKISQFICPDDGNASALGVAAPLSYIVNSNICDNRVLPGSVVDVMVSQLKKPTRTLLLGEGPMPNSPGVMVAGPWTFPLLSTTYNLASPPPAPANLAFTWSPGSSLVHLPSLTQLFVNPPYHPSVYIATFCDGHAETLSTDADCSTISTRVDGAMP